MAGSWSAEPRARRYDPGHRALGFPLHAFDQIRAAGEGNRRSESISVVIPAHNEEQSMGELLGETNQVLSEMQALPGFWALGNYEIIVVNDGSSDRTRECLNALSARYSALRVLELEERAGQSAALLTGLRAACGDWIATLDADGQNDPADLKHLWLMRPARGAVLGFRKDRQDPWLRCVLGRLANCVRNVVLGQSIRDTGCSMRLFPREIALLLPAFRGFHRFLGPLLLREGCSLVQVPVRHRPRRFGKSHYSVWNRSLNVLIDLAGVAWLMRRPIATSPFPSIESKSHVQLTTVGWSVGSRFKR